MPKSNVNNCSQLVRIFALSSCAFLLSDRTQFCSQTVRNFALGPYAILLSDRTQFCSRTVARMACYLCHIDRTIDTQRAHATTIARSTRTTSRLVNTITNLQHTHDVTAMNTYTPYKAILTTSTRTTSRLVNTITNL